MEQFELFNNIFKPPTTKSQECIKIITKEKNNIIKCVKDFVENPANSGIEGYTWEKMFHYIKGIDMPKKSNKRLFDAVTADGRGWSLKTLESKIGRNQFEFVIQRANIFKKAKKLGFTQGLNENSSPDDLGRAIIRHWNGKFHKDCSEQMITDPRMGILLKDRTTFSYIELKYQCPIEEDYKWEWSNKDKLSLRGSNNGQVRFKWYHSQKQLFEVFRIPEDQYYTFSVDKV